MFTLKTIQMYKYFILVFLLLKNIALHAQTPTVGLQAEAAAAMDNGYVLFAPDASKHTYLIDKCGKKVKEWISPYIPGVSVYILPNGNLLRTNCLSNPAFSAGGTGGAIEMRSWNDSLLWFYTISDATQCQHHDICPLPNGNILAVVWELKSHSEALLYGRYDSITSTNLWSEKIIEIHPDTLNGSAIVWTWHLWDHIVQHTDSAKLNYGRIIDHPELLDINAGGIMSGDWLHLNSITYDAVNDEIIISSHNLNEIYVIDHSTTTQQAASHYGGLSNMGGDFLYRWGNPQIYQRGTSANQQYFGQHDAQFIPPGLPNAGKILVFNNGLGRPGSTLYSSIDIIDPPFTPNHYSISGHNPYLPTGLFWSYQASPPSSFYSTLISGVQPLRNGNFLICEGMSGRFFEIDSNKNIIWQYTNPVGSAGPVSQGTPLQSAVFRCLQYDSTYIGFLGHNLISGNPIEINPQHYVCPLPNDTTTAVHLQENNKFYYALSNDKLYLSSENELLSNITLIDMQGKIVYKWENEHLNKERKVFYVNLSSGLYLLRINDTIVKILK